MFCISEPSNEQILECEEVSKAPCTGCYMLSKAYTFQLQTDFFIQCMTQVGIGKDVISGFAITWQYNQKLGKLYVTKIENPEFVLRTGNE